MFFFDADGGVYNPHAKPRKMSRVREMVEGVFDRSGGGLPLKTVQAAARLCRRV